MKKIIVLLTLMILFSSSVSAFYNDWGVTLASTDVNAVYQTQCQGRNVTSKIDGTIDRIAVASNADVGYMAVYNFSEHLIANWSNGVNDFATGSVNVKIGQIYYLFGCGTKNKQSTAFQIGKTTGTTGQFIINNPALRLSNGDVQTANNDVNVITFNSTNGTQNNVLFFSPINNSRHNTLVEMSINLTVNVTNMANDVNCTVWRNDSLTNTSQKIGNTFNVSSVIIFATFINDSNFSTTTERQFFYFIQCNESGTTNFNSTNLFVFVDNVNPLIVFGSEDIAEDNSSVVFSNPSFNVTYFDTFLFRAITNVTNMSGHIVFVNDSGNLSGSTTTFFNSTTLDIVGSGDQRYNISLSVADTSTVEEIPNYKLKLDKGKGKHSYETEHKNNVSFTLLNYNSELDQLLSRKEKDRQVFGYKFKSKKLRLLDIEIDCDGVLYDIYDSDKQGHFICSSDGLNGNWIDFEGQGRVTKYKKNGKWGVKVWTDKDFVEFQSIGGLNVVSKTILFSMSSYAVNITAQDIITNNTVSNFNVSSVAYTNNSALGNVSTLFLRSGLTNVTFNKAGYFNKTIEINVSSNSTFNISGVFTNILNITAVDNVTGDNVTNFDILVTNVSLSYSESFSTTTGFIAIPLIDGSFNFLIDNSSYALQNETILITNTLQNFTFQLFQSNSISFFVRNLVDQSLFTDPINITLIGSSITYNLNTSSGLLFFSGILADTYTARFEAPSISTINVFVTVANRSHQNLTVFVSGGNAAKDFLTQTGLGIPLNDVLITFTQNINGSIIIFTQAITDFSGRATVFLSETTNYRIVATKPEFVTFVGNVTPTEDTYIIQLASSALQKFDSIWDDVSFTTPFTYVPNSSFANASLLINSIAGNLSFYGLETTYNGVPFISNITGSPFGDEISSINITGINVSIQNIVNIKYFFLSSGRPLVTWNTTYYLPTFNGTNATITGGLFDDLLALDIADAIRGLFGALILLFFILVMGALSRDTTIATLSGMMGLALIFYLQLWPQELLIVSLIVLGALLAADNISGGFF